MSSDPKSQVRELISRSEYLAAFDVARDGLEADPSDVELGYLSVLALARSGATNRAEEEFDRLQLEAASDLGSILAEDIAVVRARLSKDRAFASSGEDAIRWASRASDEYEAAHDQHGGFFSCINAATMAFVAGDADRSKRLAQAALQLVDEGGDDDGDQAYWREASRAEAALLLGDVDLAAKAMSQAAELSAGNLSMRATTKRQLRLVCEIAGLDAGLLDVLPLPAVAHYTGHMFAADGEVEAALAVKIRTHLDQLSVGFGYGAIACGSDIMIAEALLERGAELHVVLPCSVDLFVPQSVEPGGSEWLPRFERCLEAARSVVEEPATSEVLDAGMFAYGSQLAMGYSIMRASALSTDAVQLAIWDGEVPDGPAGTGADVERWRSTGRTTVVLAPEGAQRVGIDSGEASPVDRSVRAMLFGDVRGFSQLSEKQLPVFVREVMGNLGATIDRFGDHVLFRNTWGDGIYLVLDSVAAAAECALALQTTMSALDLVAISLPDFLGLRIGGHAGPVFEADDAIRQELSFFGTHVTRTARVEPRTPEGAVYVTRAFAALFELEDDQRTVAEYVGHIPAAKEYGTFRMYVLKARG